MLVGEFGNLTAAHDAAIVVHQFGKHADRRQICQLAKIDAGLGMARAHQHAAFLGDQRKHVARPHKIGGAAVAVGQRADGVGAFFGRDTGGQAVLHIDRDSKGRAERRVVARHHRIEMQTLCLFNRQRRADDARGMPDDEAHLLRRAKRSSDEEIALILAVVVVGDDNKFPPGKGGNRLIDAVMSVEH